MVQRIVVGSDLSPRALGAVHMASELARATHASVHLVTACPSATVGVGPEVMVIPDHGGLVESSRAGLEAIADELRGTGLEVEVHVFIGDPVTALCSVAETVEADLIVVGNRRMHGAGRVLGSVPNKVAHKATCSVLIAQTE